MQIMGLTRYIIFAFVLMGINSAHPIQAAHAQVDGHHAPHPAPLQRNFPTQSPQELEQKLNNTAMPTETIKGFVHIPDEKSGVLVQPNGRLFQYYHKNIQFWIDAIVLIATFGGIIGLYFIAGTMDYEPDHQHRRIQRFLFIERLGHWITAISFTLLALTGLNLVFGRWLIMPLIGPKSFSTLTEFGKHSHNYLALPFILGLTIILIRFFKFNVPNRTDIIWLKQVGGMFNHKHVAAYKFNAGQKMIYWIAAFGGAALILTGLSLLMPFYAFNILGMQLTQIAHSLIAITMIAVIIGHVYLGVWGVKGSLEAMRSGNVDLNWARTHHDLWVKDEEKKGKDFYLIK